MNEQLDNRVEGIITGLKKQRPRNHPILEHPVSEAEEYVQKLYIDALCVAAQYANENAEERLAFVERIHSGSGLNDEFPEHIKNAMNITPERFEDFFTQCKENYLENIFVLDCLLIAGADGVPNSKQIGFAVEIAEALGMTKENISLMSELAVIILEQDSDKYHEFYEKISADDVMNIVGCAICYVRQFAAGVLIDTSELLWICSTERAQLSCEDIEFTNYKKVIIENMTIDNSVNINNCGNVFITKCYVTDSFDLQNIGSCIVKNCIFDLKTSSNEVKYLFQLSGVKDFFFIESEIFNYDMGYSSRIFSPTGEQCGNFRIERSFFCNIHGEEIVVFDENYYEGFYTYNWLKNAIICDSKFSSCSGEYLFKDRENNLTLENNTYENCCDVIQK